MTTSEVKAVTSSSPSIAVVFDASLDRLTKDVIAQFDRDGYVVLDNFFGASLSSNYRKEIKWLYANEAMLANCTATMKRDDGIKALSQKFVKPGIFEAELIRPEIREHVPHLKAMYEICAPLLLERIAELLPRLGLSQAEGGASIKLQMNTGEGGCFPLHYDGPGGTKDSRRVTALLYLNPDWKPAHGGSLRILPWMQQPVDIEPIFDRFVLFFSDRGLHRTMPATKERVCFTIWMHGNGIDPPLDAKAMEGLPAAEQMMLNLQQPSMQRYVSKALYSDEYVASLTEAHREHAAALLDIHHKDVALIEQTPGLASMVAFLKDFIKEKQRPILYSDLAERMEEDRLLLAMIAKRNAVDASEERQSLQRQQELEEEETARRHQRNAVRREARAATATALPVTVAASSISTTNTNNVSSSLSSSLAGMNIGTPQPSSPSSTAVPEDDDCTPNAPDVADGEDDWMAML